MLQTMASFFCLLTNLTAHPNSISHFQDLSLIVLPVNRYLCGGINPDTELTYELYTRNNVDTPAKIQINDDKLLNESNLDFEKQTIFFFHGFMESSQSDDAQVIKNNFLEKKDVNVILVNAEILLAGPYYITATRNVQAIGHYSGKFIDYLVTQGLNLSRLHIIGMSLGGQAAGITGSSIKSGKPARITGLDPAGPLFIGLPESERIDASDGEFVEICHSNAGIFGYPFKCGHVDFWINGGGPIIQPGCDISSVISRDPGYIIPELVFCSHWRSYQTYAETINNPEVFPGRKCTDWTNYELGNCDTNEVAYMGDLANNSYNGNYYVKTTSSPPYTLN